MNQVLLLVKMCYIPVSLSFILYVLWINQSLLRKMIEVANLNFLVLAVLIWGALHFLAPLSTGFIFSCMGSPVSYSKLLGIYISKLPAKYLPGGIWHTVGRISAYNSLGISKKHLSILVLVDTFSPCLITFLIGGGCLWFFGNDPGISTIEGLLSLICLSILILLPFCIKKYFFSYWENHFLFWYVSLILLSIFFWFLASIAFLFYYSSVSFNMSSLSLSHIAATYVFSWGIGYISIFAPQGIGVFEVVAGKLMQFPMGLGSAVAFLAGFRIIALAADSIVWSLYSIYVHVQKKNKVQRY